MDDVAFFRTDISPESGDGPYGWAVAAALREGLRADGIGTEEPQPFWDGVKFVCRAERYRFEVEITPIFEATPMKWAVDYRPAGLWKRLPAFTRSARARLLAALDRALTIDPRFRCVEWDSTKRLEALRSGSRASRRETLTHPFHLAFPVRDLDETRRFYENTLGCRTGRSGADWLDIDFFGSQIVAHVLPGGTDALPEAGVNRIDGHEVPLPHFGCVLPMDRWRAMADRLRRAGVDFLIAPHVRYEGRFNEQASMIFRDPSGNVIELKAFADPSTLFERRSPGR